MKVGKISRAVFLALFLVSCGPVPAQPAAPWNSASPDLDNSASELVRVGGGLEKGGRRALAALYYLKALERAQSEADRALARAALMHVRLRTLHESVARRYFALVEFFAARARWHDVLFALSLVRADYAGTPLGYQAQTAREALLNGPLRFELRPYEQDYFLQFDSVAEGKSKNPLFRFTYLGSPVEARLGDTVAGFRIERFDDSTREVFLKRLDYAPIVLPAGQQNVTRLGSGIQVFDRISLSMIDGLCFPDAVVLKSGTCVAGMITARDKQGVELDSWEPSGRLEPRRIEAKKIAAVLSLSAPAAGKEQKNPFESCPVVPSGLRERAQWYLDFFEYEKAAVCLADIFEKDSTLWDSYGRDKAAWLKDELESKSAAAIERAGADAYLSRGYPIWAAMRYARAASYDAAPEKAEAQKKLREIVSRNLFFRFDFFSPCIEIVPVRFVGRFKETKSGSGELYRVCADGQKETELPAGQTVGGWKIKGMYPPQKGSAVRAEDWFPAVEVQALLVEPESAESVSVLEGFPLRLPREQATALVFDRKTGRAFPAFLYVDWLKLKDEKIFSGIMTLVQKKTRIISFDSLDWQKFFDFEDDQIAEKHVQTRVAGEFDLPRAQWKTVWDSFARPKRVVREEPPPFRAGAAPAKTEAEPSVVAPSSSAAPAPDQPAHAPRAPEQDGRQLLLYGGAGAGALLVFVLIPVLVRSLRRRRETRGVQRRKHPRKKVKEQTLYRVLREVKGAKPDPNDFAERFKLMAEKKAEIFDISLGGVGLLCDEAPAVGLTVQISLRNPATDETRPVYGRVANTRPSDFGFHAVGVQWLEPEAEFVASCMQAMKENLPA